VIDDDSLVRDSLTHLLLLWGCQVEQAAGGVGLAQALYGRKWHPVVVLCDYRLADGMDGIAVIRSLREVFGQTLPAAIITGDTELQALRNLGQENIRVLYKPVRSAQLRSMIKNLRATTD
jgi:CheY-like chemotaxis protein